MPSALTSCVLVRPHMSVRMPNEGILCSCVWRYSVLIALRGPEQNNVHYGPLRGPNKGPILGSQSEPQVCYLVVSANTLVRT